MTKQETEKHSTIILIDDDPDVREVLAKLLIDHRVYAFPSGDKAVEWLKRQTDIRPDYVMSDCILPGMNGIETLQKIREISPDAKLILMSAAVPDSLERAVAENNFDGFIPNPFSASDGNAMIKDALNPKAGK